MYENSTEMKIWRSISPVLLYLFVNMLVQVVFTIAVTMREFAGLGGKGMMSYFVSYNFSGDIERVVSENGLAVTLISGIITIPIGLWMMKRDADSISYMRIKERMRSIRLKQWYFIVLIGMFASMGLSKAVTILPIDNIWGSYAKVGKDFAANPIGLQLVALVLVGPVLEEIIFRGLVYNRIKRYTNSIKGVYISAAVFGVYHFNLVQGLYGFALGILLCYVYEKYHTIAAPVILHFIANLAALLMIYSEASTVINGNVFLKLLFMVLELGALAAVLWRLESRKNIFERGKE